MDFTTLAKVTYSDQRILTTEQITEFYGCTTDNIKKNFNANKERFSAGKHYFKIEGEALKIFKNKVTESYFVNNNKVTESYPVIGKNANVLYLWTKRGAALHAKMLSTDKAWEVFEMLVDNYFDAQEKVESAPNVENAVAVQNQPPVLKSTLLVNALKNAALIKKTLTEDFGVKDGIADATSLSMVEKSDGVDLSEVKAVLPPAEHEIGYFTPTQLAKKFGLKSAHVVNQILVEKGLQEKVGKVYILTEEGKKYGEAMPFNNNGHSGYQIKWWETVSDFFK